MSEQESVVERGRADIVAWERDKPHNFLDADPNIQRVLAMHLGERYHVHWPMLSRTAGLAATRMDALARLTNLDENLPALRRFNAFGEQCEDVVFNPAHDELGSLIWSSGVLAVQDSPGNDLLSGTFTYFISHNGEAGHACPVACTTGLIKLLQQVGSEEQRERYLPRLLETDYGRRLHASQFVTEVQGGSDVGANECYVLADEQTGAYRLFGEKWFCSVMDAGVFVVSARPPDARLGTSGLGLFLVPRAVGGLLNRFSIRRLKSKLGTRSLATGEVDFGGSHAEPIGPLDQGFKNLVSIALDTSRLHNSVAACGMMRRAFVEAQTYAQYRKAFGAPLIHFPLVKSTLTRMKMLTTASVASTFRLLALYDRLALSERSEDLRAARRIQTMINKYWASLRCSEVVHDGIEILGGNGTIEDFSVLPRLYRDAMVLESWEGTHNTLCVQVLRDFSQRQLHLPWLEEQYEALGRVRHEAFASHRERARSLLEELASRIERLLVGPAEAATLHIRPVIDRMCLANTFISLLLELDWEQGEHIQSDKALLVELYRSTYIDPVDSLDHPELDALHSRLSATL